MKEFLRWFFYGGQVVEGYWVLIKTEFDGDIKRTYWGLWPLRMIGAVAIIIGIVGVISLLIGWPS